MNKKNLINYAGASRELKITTGALYRFEDSGYTLADFDKPEKQIRAHVALIGAAMDPGEALATVAENCPAFPELSAAIAAALGDTDVTNEYEATPQGNGSEAGDNSAPSPASNSGSKRKSLKAQAQPNSTR